MRWMLLSLLLLPVSAHAALTDFWVSNGNKKIAQDDLPPGTTNQNWSHAKAMTFGGGNETVSLVLFMGNDTGSDITNVTVELSSFTKTGTDGIVSVEVSSGNVWDYSERPITQYFVRYVPIQGMTQLSWDGTEYDQYHLPEQFRRPCTENGNGQCVADGGTVWEDRPDYDKFYPDALIPWEAIKHSSFTVYSSSSQAIWADVYISTDLATGVYEAEWVVKEDVTVSTRIPVELTVRNYTLPDTPSLKVMAVMSAANVSQRVNGVEFPGSMDEEPYFTTRNRFYHMIHAHGMSPIGDDRTSSDSPYQKDINRLDGTLYEPTTGYANARGVLTADHTYSIGTYGSWDNDWSPTDASDFCSHVSAWRTYMKNNYPDAEAFVYLTDEPADLTDTDKWSTWMSTSPACQVADSDVKSMVTARWTDTETDAPAVNFPSTTQWMNASSETWKSAHDFYNNQSSAMTGGYNFHPPWSGPSVFATEDEGISPLATFWAMYHYGLDNWFLWETTYYADDNNDGNDNDVWDDAMTFGYYTSDDPVKGRTGTSYSNGDGFLIYPGSDTIHTEDSYGIDAPFPSWRLKMVRRGIQDGDYLTLASAIDSTETAAVVDKMIGEMFYEFECFTIADCTYAYGERPWVQNPDTWEIARSDLADILESTSPAIFESQGKTIFQGGVTFQ